MPGGRAVHSVSLAQGHQVEYGNRVAYGGRGNWPKWEARGVQVGGEDVSGDPRAARQDGRAVDQLRPVRFERDYTVMAPGSVLVTFGQTKVLCTASVEERVPPWMRGSGKGWVTAEYSMLPGSTPDRASREAARGKQSGRTQEIQRLIA